MKRSTDSISQQSDFVMGAVTTANPKTYVQQVSEVPTGVKTSVVPAMNRVTAKAVPQSIKRSRVNGSFTLNLPWRDYVPVVSNIFMVMRSMAENYQRTHQDAFFEAWPQLIKLGPGEVYPTTAAARRNYRVYCRRVANRMAKYIDARTMLDGCLANLLTASRLSGDQVMREIAYQTRWSKINTATNLFARFKAIKGQQQYVANNTRFATGYTGYGADILCIGLWNTSYFSSPACHTIPHDNYFTNKGMDGDQATTADIYSPSGAEAISMRDLIDNIEAVIGQYDTFRHPITVNGKTRLWRFKCPTLVENGNVTIVSNEDDTRYIYFNNKGGEKQDLESCPDNKFTDVLWNNYYLALQNMVDNFPEFMDPNSDWNIFFTTQIPLLEDSMTAQDMLNVIRANANFDMVKDLLPHMEYKKNNAVNLATIVNRYPIIGWNDGTQDTDSFAENYEFINPDEPNVAYMLQRSKAIPTIYPQVFGGGSGNNGDTSDGVPYYPIVINTIPTTGVEGVAVANTARQTGDSSFVPTPMGKVASYLDISCTRSLDPESTQLTFLGQDQASVESFVKACDGMTYEEDPTTVRALIMPLINCSDPYQCGFNLFIDVNDVNPSEIQRMYLDPSNYGVNDIDIAFTEQGVDHYTVKEGGSDVAVPMHIASSTYQRQKQYFHVFVGDGIFNLPAQNFADSRASNLLWKTLVFARKASDEPTACYYDEFLTHWAHDDEFEGAAFDNTTAGAVSDIDAQNSVVRIANMFINSEPFVTDSNGVAIAELTFNPAYGPVHIPTMVEDLSGYGPLDPWTGNAENMADPSLDVPTFLLGVADVDSWDVHGTGFTRSAVNSTKLAGNKWFPTLNSIQFRPCTHKSQGMITLLGTGPCKPLMFKAQMDYARSLMSKVIAQFTGIEDTKPFWMSESLKKALVFMVDNNVTASGGDMPHDDVLAEPRVPRTAMASKRDYSTVKPASGEKTDYYGNYAKSNFKGGSTDDRPKRSFKSRKHRGRKFESREKDTSLTGVLSDSTVTKGSSGGFMDVTSEATDKKVADKSKKPTNVESMIVG